MAASYPAAKAEHFEKIYRLKYLKLRYGITHNAAYQIVFGTVL
jgi:hypothetical protein